ncbi:hypothetical protein ABEW03_18665 [Virgibacillus pantothenticus]|uniref:hypothetical protein n=1 Tax=Virgibacillus pantothenticus TaxID=1473 RepID=UPI003D2A8838
MIRRPSLLKSYFFIRVNRFKKKRKLNKMASQLIFDKTTSIYLGLLLAYTFASIFIFSDTMKLYGNYFVFLEQHAEEVLGFLAVALPVRYIFNSFREPGVLYSTAEYKLAFLPYRRGNIWLLTLMERWLKKLLIYSLIGAIAVLLTPFRSQLVFTFVAVFILFDIIMAIPQWKLFQQRFIVKIGVFFLAVAGIGLFSLVQEARLIAALIVGCIGLVNLFLLPHLFSQINWSKVTEINDYTIWRMPLMGFASKTKFKRPKRYAMFQNSKQNKKPFTTNAQIYDRIWKLYFVKQHALIFQSLGTLLILVTVLLFMPEWLFSVGAAIMVYVYTSLTASFYADRFSNDMIEILPWSLKNYTSHFLKFTRIGMLLLFVPVIIFYFMHPSWWIPLHILLFWTAYRLIREIKMMKTIQWMTRKKVSLQLEETMGTIAIICLALSGIYPFLTISSLVLWFILYRRNSKTSSFCDKERVT